MVDSSEHEALFIIVGILGVGLKEFLNRNEG